MNMLVYKENKFRNRYQYFLYSANNLFYHRRCCGFHFAAIGWYSSPVGLQVFFISCISVPKKLCE